MNNLIKDKDINTAIELLEAMHPDARCALDYDSIFHLVIAVSLSAQTTDVNVNKVTPQLFAKYPTPESLAEANVDEVEQLIRSIGLYKNKSKNIIAMSKMLVTDFNGVVPREREELMRLPGVGRKTANVVLAEGYQVPAIAVDTHVFRVANRIGITNADNVTDTEKQLMERLPEEKWIRVHHLIIFHGRRICYARNPNCENCLLNTICLSAK